MRGAATAVKAILSGRPDYGKESPEYVVTLTESLSYLSDEELAWLTNPRDGLATVCKYLPTPADVHEFLRQKKAKAEEFKPAHTNYRRLNEDKGPWEQETDFERKRRVVMECLGYNPDERGAPSAKRTLTPPSAEDVRNLKLKTPAARPSAQLINLLKEQGWPFIPADAAGNKQETGEAA